jgi:enoyl-CoA hydratase/carnithine racemase
MNYSTIEVRREAGTGWILLARPKVRNALNARFFDELHRAVDELVDDASIRTLVLMGKGGVFSAGRDFKDREVPPDFEDRRARAFAALEYCEKPTIAAVASYAVTGGLTLATTCDIIIAAEDAIFQDTHAKFGIISMRASRLIELIGPLKTKELLFTCRRVGAQEALAMGLVNKVVPGERLETEAREIAAVINGHDAGALKAIKHVINKVVRQDQSRILDLEELEKRRFHDLLPENKGLDRGLSHLASRA